MWTKEFLSQILESLAGERRRVAAGWRIWLHAHRIMAAQHQRLGSSDTAETLVAKMQRLGHLSAIDGVEGVFVVAVPFASVLPISDEQILQEANPWAVLSHLTAMIHHQLTDSVSSSIYATAYAGLNRSRSPLGTSSDDWMEMRLPKPRRPKHVDGVPIVWVAMKESLDWGSEVGYSQGIPVYVTDLERTLLDALRQPAKAGGTFEVLRAWGEARKKMDIDRLVSYAERYDVRVLRQRVGFILNTMGFDHERLHRWRKSLLRGGSMKLIAGREYGERYDVTWNISLNVPDSALQALRG